jgi:hypothetical protein
MFCSKCGTQLLDEANFCWKCGLPQKEGVVAEEPRYEACEISWRYTLPQPIFAIKKFQFVAVAIGPTGKRVVAETPLLSTGSAGRACPPLASTDGRAAWDQSHEAVDAMIIALVADGWEYQGPFGDGRYWQKSFRRRVKQQTDKKA